VRFVRRSYMFEYKISTKKMIMVVVVVVVYIVKNAAAKGMPEPKSLNIEQQEEENS